MAKTSNDHFIALLYTLIDEECESVTMLAANADFCGPAYAIDCNGPWTNFRDLRFDGESRIECMQKAVQARQRALSDAAAQKEKRRPAG